MSTPFQCRICQQKCIFPKKGNQLEKHCFLCSSCLVNIQSENQLWKYLNVFSKQQLKPNEIKSLVKPWEFANYICQYEEYYFKNNSTIIVCPSCKFSNKQTSENISSKFQCLSCKITFCIVCRKQHKSNQCSKIEIEYNNTKEEVRECPFCKYYNKENNIDCWNCGHYFCWKCMNGINPYRHFCKKH